MTDLLRKHIQPLAIAAAMIIALGCASGPQHPDWLQGASPRYPNDRYAVGIGAGPDAQTAAAKAVHSIEEQTGGQSEGAEVADTWTDPDSGVHWALAVLDRGQAVDRLRSELAALDAQIARTRSRAETEAPEEVLRELSGAVALLDERDELRRRIVALGAEPPSSDADAARDAQALRQQLAELKRKLRIEIDAFEIDEKTGEPGDRIEENRRTLVQKTLELGFAVDSADAAWGSNPVWLRVDSKVSVDRLQLLPTDTLVAMRWTVAVEITDIAAGGDVVAILTEEGRATHLNETEASRLARADALAFAASALEAWLQDRSTGTKAAQ